MTEILLDTNVLIYALDRDSIYYMWARRFFDDSSRKCVITSKNVAEFLCVMTRGENPALSVEEAIATIKVFASNCRILYPDYASANLLLELIARDQVRGLKVHDYEIASIALSNDVNLIATVNKNDFKIIPGLELVTPA